MLSVEQKQANKQKTQNAKLTFPPRAPDPELGAVFVAEYGQNTESAPSTPIQTGFEVIILNLILMISLKYRTMFSFSQRDRYFLIKGWDLTEVLDPGSKQSKLLWNNRSHQDWKASKEILWAGTSLQAAKAVLKQLMNILFAACLL